MNKKWTAITAPRDMQLGVCLRANTTGILAKIQGTFKLMFCHQFAAIDRCDKMLCVCTFSCPLTVCICEVK